MKRNQIKLKIGIWGYGNMGRSILELLQKKFKSDKAASFYIYSLNLKKARNAICLSTAEELMSKCDLVFLCIKPQDFYSLAPLKTKNKNLIIISIMAGVRIKNIRKIIPASKIVRTMPNLPLKIGCGVTGWHVEKGIFNLPEIKLIEKILSCFGSSICLDKESRLDAITAISGSGPAYVFLFINAIIKAAQKFGFSQKQAWQVAMETTIGSAKYASLEKNKNLEQLIDKVRSKKGTTEAALNELNVTKFYKKWEQAINKAFNRAKEISSYEIK